MGKNKNRFFEALIKLMLVSATIHMFLLIVYSFSHFDMSYLNYFNILDIDLFFPGVINGFVSQIFSIVTIIIIYTIIYIYFTKKETPFK